MTGPGAAAEYVTAPAEVLVRAPANIPLINAAAIPVPALTAWQALFEHGDLVAGQRVLVNGAGGGVGGFVVQLAKQAGATVIATSSPRSADPDTRRRSRPHHRLHRSQITDTLDRSRPRHQSRRRHRQDTGACSVIAPAGALVSATAPGGEFPDASSGWCFSACAATRPS